VEKHFTDTHFRQADERYVVSLPTKPSVNDLGDIKQRRRTAFHEQKTTSIEKK
jgi:hypothetical protein